MNGLDVYERHPQVSAGSVHLEARPDGRIGDTGRVAFLRAHLVAIHRAIDAGPPVIGYIHWSLLDNFEWMMGYRPKFGLVAVNRETQERTPKASAAFLGDIAKRNSM